jgi:hypothetical protein
MTHLPEEHESLWMLTAAPAIWAVHFLASYLTSAIWCAKLAGPDGALGSVRVALALYTVLALTGIGIIGWRAFRRHRFGSTTVPHDFDSREGRHRFPVRHPAAVGPERSGDPLRGPRRCLHWELSLMRRASWSVACHPRRRVVSHYGSSRPRPSGRT